MKTTYYKKRTKAAKWLLADKRTETTLWNTWAVLTDKNPDAEALRLSHVTASQIFNDMIKAELLVPIIGKAKDEAGNIVDVGAYRLDRSNPEKWDEFMAVSSRMRQFRRMVWNFLNAPIFVALLTGLLALAGAYFGADAGSSTTEVTF